VDVALGAGPGDPRQQTLVPDLEGVAFGYVEGAGRLGRPAEVRQGVAVDHAVHGMGLVHSADVPAPPRPVLDAGDRPQVLGRGLRGLGEVGDRVGGHEPLGARPDLAEEADGAHSPSSGSPSSGEGESGVPGELSSVHCASSPPMHGPEFHHDPLPSAMSVTCDGESLIKARAIRARTDASVARVCIPGGSPG
jgi:hypothetical protein